MKYNLAEIGRSFGLVGDFLAAQPYGSGHINDTFMAEYDQGGNRVRYIHQRINQNIFRSPARLMDNIKRVTDHQREKIRAAGWDEPSRRALTVIPTKDGASFLFDDEGNAWRTYIFIENAKTYDLIKFPVQARAAARAFGAFLCMLADLPGERLHETITDFHNTPQRFAKLISAVQNDPCQRLLYCGPEVEFARQREAMTAQLLELCRTGEIPERITHNDTKLNNVMLDDLTQEGICVIDLDTVMPGLAMYDFGDMIRTSVATAAEDEPDIGKVNVRMDMFEALAAGYMETAGNLLNEIEKDHLAFGGKLMTFENGLRFLTDYLTGDSYFKTTRENHNLDRCRNQFALVKAIEELEPEMQQIVRKYR